MSIEVRDPIHGSIAVDDAEVVVMDHPLFQRLRRIRQLGFGELAYPGATHTRYLHSLGAMELAGQAFDALFSGHSLGGPERRAALRSCLRMAALLHDVGHAPMSHASEFAMPPAARLEIPHVQVRPGRRATHEDYTLKIVLDSPLTSAIEASGRFAARSVASLIERSMEPGDDLFVVEGVDHRPLLSQLVSSELDMDRMDYLTRDSYFTGVQYGSFDLRWLVTHLRRHVVDDRAHLALSQKAVYTFDHFLIARYHMFILVYFHYRCVAFEEMLRRYLTDEGCEYTIPADVEAYGDCDDLELMGALRASRSDWARRIVNHDEYKLLTEQHGRPEDLAIAPLTERLRAAGVPLIEATSSSVLSKYFDPKGRGGDAAPAPIFVFETPVRGGPERAVPLELSTDLFERYSGKRQLARIYVPREHLDRARALLLDPAG